MNIKFYDVVAALEAIETTSTEHEDAIDVAIDCIMFTQALNNLFRDQGAVVPDVPDCNVLENLIDAYNGELAAACLFLADKAFATSPAMLRTIADSFAGLEGNVVPSVVVKGFRRLANRIENTRVQMQSLHQVISSKD